MRRDLISTLTLKELETEIKKRQEEVKLAEELRARQQAWDRLVQCQNRCGCGGGCREAYEMSLAKEDRQAITIAIGPKIINEEWVRRGQIFHKRQYCG